MAPSHILSIQCPSQPFTTVIIIIIIIIIVIIITSLYFTIIEASCHSDYCSNLKKKRCRMCSQLATAPPCLPDSTSFPVPTHCQSLRYFP